MLKGGKKEYLSRALESHVRSIQETLQMLERPADSSLEKVDWAEVIKLGDRVAKQATVAGMLWSGETKNVKDLESNMEAYCNTLHGFLLICHSSTGGAGPTLHASILVSAKQVVDCSISLLREAVASCDSHNSNKKLSIPQLSGSVWEACNALKKNPTTNCTAIGRAITQVAVSLKDVLREMKELKPAPSTDTGNGVDDHANEDGGSSEDDLGDDLSLEEMNIAQLATDVVSNALVVIKGLIRFITSLLKRSNRETMEKDYVESLERLLSFCQEMGSQVNELGASVYPPQEMSQMKLISRKIQSVIDDARKEVCVIGSPPEVLLGIFGEAENSLEKLECGLSCLKGDGLAPEIERLAV